MASLVEFPRRVSTRKRSVLWPQTDEELDAAPLRRPRTRSGTTYKSWKHEKQEGDGSARKQLSKPRSTDEPAALPPVVAHDGPAGLSEYELKRRDKMAANVKFLQRLGMAYAQMELTAQLQSASGAAKKRAEAKPKKPATDSLRVRRSARLYRARVPAMKQSQQQQEERRLRAWQREAAAEAAEGIRRAAQ